MSSREQFEAWIAGTTNSDLHRGIMLDRHENGRYRHLATENKWEAWQEATKQSEAKCAALAAENACLKQSIEEVAEAFETGTDGALAAAVDESLNLLTPETDAVLKRIQAQGVAMFASKCKEESKRAHSSDARDSWWVSGENADDFASQLRNGAQS